MTGMQSAAAARSVAQIDEASFRRLSEMVHRDSGIVLTEAKKNLIASRLARRLRELEFEDFSQYCRFIEERGGAEERGHLISLLTTNVTRFFREGHHFEVLERDVLPPLAARAGAGGRVRIWSAGCSTGEEPYSIAMSVLKVFPDAPRRDLRILGTDIDPTVIRTGKAAEYANIDETHLPTEMRKQFFEELGAGTGRYRIKPDPRQLVSLAELNLLQDWPMKGPFDVIFCRNVVIYFDAPTQIRLWSRFADMLAPGGHLFVGHSERVDTSSEPRLAPVGVTQYQRLP